jgi:molybdopterin/thiamine biosynthesis adenylyltransferase
MGSIFGGELMSSIRIPEHIYQKVKEYLFIRWGEHFAFFLANLVFSGGKPIFLVDDVILVPDEQAHDTWDHLELSADGYLMAVNKAIKSGRCLIEIHNHFGNKPRFSHIDRDGMKEFVPYVLKSLSGQPYAATVWSEDTAYGVYFMPGEISGEIRSITVFGERFHQIVSKDDDLDPIGATFQRQLPWFTEQGQKRIARIKVGIVGLGGTGSHIVQQLAYVGVRQFLLIDDDCADNTNLNRLVTAGYKQIGISKVHLAEEMIRKISPNVDVQISAKKLQDEISLDALRGVDIIFGCVDNDGARLILNELALSYNIPYFDVSVGINASDGVVSAAGGYLAVVLPGGPCLLCMDQIDQEEARYFLATKDEQAFQRKNGYIQGVDVPAPAVVSLNGLLASAAVNELLVYLSGIRPVNPLSMYDMLGIGRAASQWMTPVRVVPLDGCVHCNLAGKGDQSNIMRYASLE